MNFQDKIEKSKAIKMSPVVLAFIGDAVYSLFVREKVAFETDYKSGKLNEFTSKIVSAKTQAELAGEILPFLTDEEADIFRRGRNAKKPSHSKNAKISDYNKSTGFEAVVGYLYVIGNYDRLNYVLNFHNYDAVTGTKVADKEI